MNTYLGEIVALLTALLWSVTSLLFTIASKQVGSEHVNRIRLLIATVILSLVHFLWQGTLLPIDAEPSRWGWLGVSAILGLVVGDGLLYYAFTAIGTRLAMLLMTLSPVIGTFLAWVFLHETLGPVKIGAILITMSSVAWVTLERGNANPARHSPRDYLIGVLCGIGSAFGQATGLILSKQGMSGDFPALSASLIRLFVAMITIWLWALLRGQGRAIIQGLRNRRAAGAILGGSLVGPVLGMTLSLIAVQLTHVGIASTLMSLSPVLLLPLVHWIFKEPISLQAIIGTVVAIVGVALIFWV